MRRKIAMLVIAAMVGLIPIGIATSAYASSTECSSPTIANDNVSTEMCIYVNGSGTWVNYVQLDISDGSASPSGSDIWWPTATGCTVQPGWISYNKSGNGTSHWAAAKSCASYKSSGGYVTSVNGNVSIGELCGYWYFVQYGQEYGTGCVGIT